MPIDRKQGYPTSRKGGKTKKQFQTQRSSCVHIHYPDDINFVLYQCVIQFSSLIKGPPMCFCVCLWYYLRVWVAEGKITCTVNVRI